MENHKCISCGGCAIDDTVTNPVKQLSFFDKLKFKSTQTLTSGLIGLSISFASIQRACGGTCGSCQGCYGASAILLALPFMSKITNQKKRIAFIIGIVVLAIAVFLWRYSEISN